MKSEINVTFGNRTYKTPVIIGTEGEHAVDIRKLRSETGFITYDEGYANTGSCESAITFIDGEKGILRFRGYPIEELAERSNFIESAYLVIYGDLPKMGELEDFRNRILLNSGIHEALRSIVAGFPPSAHPMAALSAMLNALGCYYPELSSNDRQQGIANFDHTATVLISKVRALAAMSHRYRTGLPVVYPRRGFNYCENFLHMMFSYPGEDIQVHPDIAKALDTLLLLHIDHEQNCSTSTVRMVGSGGANLFTSVSAGVCALWGPRHGGANQAVIEMLTEINERGESVENFVEKVKKGECRLMGFGHRVYKNYDPRAKVLSRQAEKIVSAMGAKEADDPLLVTARKLEEIALNDDYFKSRNLYPNVDFYSGIILRELGIPVDMFPVIFAMGRMPGWIAQWREMAMAPSGGKIYRPRQIYVGENERHFVPLTERE
ncbi:MAG: citrate synthase [Opitutales bacterium]|nr:citrate synthase [Opitutales bacterium]